MKRSFTLGLQAEQRVHVQRFFRERRSERDPFAGVIKRERESATHERDGADAVTKTRDVQQRRNVAHAVRRSHHELRWSAVQSQFGGWDLARAKLVFETIDLDVAGPAFIVASF